MFSIWLVFKHRSIKKVNPTKVMAADTGSKKLVLVLQASDDDCDIFLCLEYNAVAWISEVTIAYFK